MTEMTHEEATEACNSIAEQLGKHHARRIMTQVVTLSLEPDEMEAMVHQCVDEVRAFTVNGGACAHDAEAIAQRVRVALVKEGVRLSRDMTWDAGHA